MIPVSTNISTDTAEENTQMIVSELSLHEKEMLSKIKSVKNQTIEEIIRCCYGNNYDPKNKHVICIQGSSSSGKSTLAHNIYKLFLNNNIPCILLECDKYYKSLTKGQLLNVNQGKYDFDNPASIDWLKISAVLKGIHTGDEYLDLFDYSFFTMQSIGPIKTKNIHPSVIIIEGIYAFNTLNEKIFNINDFDPLNSCKKIITEYVDNNIKYPDFKILNVKMSMCKGKSLQVRIARDVISRGKEREPSILQFERYVWPATSKWVYNNIYNSHITIHHGTFNEKKVRLFVGSLTGFFLKQNITFDNMFKDGNYNKEAMIECSGECNVDKNTEIFLKEDLN